MTQDKWTVGELNQILANNLVPGGEGGASENVHYAAVGM